MTLILKLILLLILINEQRYSRKTEFDGHAKFYKLPLKTRIICRTIYFVMVLLIILNDIQDRISFTVISFTTS